MLLIMILRDKTSAEKRNPNQREVLLLPRNRNRDGKNVSTFAYRACSAVSRYEHESSRHSALIIYPVSDLTKASALSEQITNPGERASK